MVSDSCPLFLEKEKEGFYLNNNDSKQRAAVLWTMFTILSLNTLFLKTRNTETLQKRFKKQHNFRMCQFYYQHLHTGLSTLSSSVVTETLLVDLLSSKLQAQQRNDYTQDYSTKYWHSNTEELLLKKLPKMSQHSSLLYQIYFVYKYSKHIR